MAGAGAPLVRDASTRPTMDRYQIRNSEYISCVNWEFLDLKRLTPDKPVGVKRKSFFIKCKEVTTKTLNNSVYIRENPW